jgi:hypothetical protein
MLSGPYESHGRGDGLQTRETDNNAAGTGYRRLGRKQQKAIEGWSVGFLGAIAMFGVTYASFPHSW